MSGRSVSCAFDGSISDRLGKALKGVKVETYFIAHHCLTILFQFCFLVPNRTIGSSLNI